MEVVSYPARLDIRPITGEVTFAADVARRSVSLRAIQDVEAEGNEVFAIKLISSKGARVSESDGISKLTGKSLHAFWCSSR